MLVPLGPSGGEALNFGGFLRSEIGLLGGVGGEVEELPGLVAGAEEFPVAVAGGGLAAHAPEERARGQRTFAAQVREEVEAFEVWCPGFSRSRTA